ncbi:McrB family protein [Clostridium perfringens]|uniref:McrB family protein n=1 Tax=Clostridium perfringens TaxID=1502 RepID=UPI001C841F60|nr:AAA family ATPase [Clostridium perfringens]
MESGIFKKKLGKSESSYYIDFSTGDSKKISSNSQGSYNLSNDFFNFAKRNNVLIEDEDMEYNRKGIDGNAFVLNSDYKLKLGLGVLVLIGTKYWHSNNKFIASVAPSNGKLQINKSVCSGLNDYEYGWFVDLYNNNLKDNQLVLDVDLINKVLKIDVILSGLDLFQVSYKGNIDKPHNRIIFGAPGTGKSNKLENEKSVFGNNFERVTFHPNYSYSQFVGTYKPVPKKVIAENGVETETITYEYVPGPFMRSLVKAIRSIKSEDPNPYLLLIEEINRANVAAVFGDVFQLLDRKNGISEYAIETSEDMRSYLLKELGGDLKDYEKIRIPANLYIWATMNSADQGVFPMDTAFKRRWEFEYIGINENSSGMENVMVKLGEDNHEVNWNNLRKAINNKLSIDCKVNEDKLIGPYFLSNDIIKVSEGSNFVEDNDKFKKAFKSKVIMYLFEDAAKQRKQDLFVGCDCSRYSLICEAFDAIGEGIFGSDIISTESEEK